ncbi:MAG: Imidazolonepropionase [Deltaproteobacteria bacterium]|nr:Imidazolonepropionase [Deltaproteobacteria bacterium]
MTGLVIRNAHVMTCDPSQPGLGLIARGAIVVRDGTIAWVGDDETWPAAAVALGAPVRSGELPRRKTLDFTAPDWNVIDARGQLVTPGLVDCHTHAIFAGDRANEFAMRAAGRTYLEIAAAGGGIAATLGPTRAASADELLALLSPRLDAVLAGGTTTIEIKSGYDLTIDGELRLLRCLAIAAKATAPRIIPTLLAHLVPVERQADRGRYLRELCEDLVPAVARERLATSVDVYCDEGAFTLDETRAILGAARRAGLAVRGHVGQFRDLGAAELLGELGALSGDHLEQVSDAGIAALAGAGVVAVMLPGACVQLRLPVPPVERLRRAGVAMAVATDLNPGSSYSESLPLQLWLATTHLAMTVEEAWLGVTRNAARALGLAGLGTLVVSAPGDLVIWRCTDPATVPYHYGSNLVEDTYVAGTHVTMRPRD